MKKFHITKVQPIRKSECLINSYNLRYLSGYGEEISSAIEWSLKAYEDKKTRYNHINFRKWEDLLVVNFSIKLWPSMPFFDDPGSMIEMVEHEKSNYSDLEANIEYLEIDGSILFMTQNEK